MNEVTLAAIHAHMTVAYPKEACGLLLADGTYVPCLNSAASGQDFRISASEWARAEDQGEVVRVIHSHPDWSTEPSESDRVSCEATEIPWTIYSVHTVDGVVQVSGEFTLVPSGYQSPLLGRPFFHGTLDCLQIILDFYARELGVDLGKYEREDGWWDEGKDYYRELLPLAGFVKLEGLVEEMDLKTGDVVLMQIKSPVPNHAGIFLKEGVLKTMPDLYPAPGSILHHLYGFDSKRDVYGGYWLKCTTSVWRYHGPVS